MEYRALVDEKRMRRLFFHKEAGMLHCVVHVHVIMLVIFHHSFVASAAYFAVDYGRPAMVLVTKID